MDANRILIFDSRASAGPVMGKALSRLGHKAQCCKDPALAVALFTAAKVDMALIYLDEADASLGLVGELGSLFPGAPLLIATSADNVDLRIQGLSKGATDYLISPFAPEYLWERMATALRRSVQVPARLQRWGSVMLDADAGRIGDGRRWTSLTPTERRTFSLLFEHGERPVSKQRIKEALSEAGDLSDNAVEVVIYRLRAKAQRWGMQIRTCRGLGYVLEHSRATVRHDSC